MLNPNKIPKLLKQELQYKGSILEVYTDYVDVCGHKTKWDRVTHHGAAAILPILDNGNILLVKQYRLVPDRFTIEIPAGKLDKDEYDKEGDEKFYNCAKRELEEETGFKSENIEFLLNYNTAMAYCSEFLKIYVARDLQKGHINFDPDEDIEIQEWKLEDIKNEILLGKISDGKTIAGILAYEAKYLK